MWGAEPWGEDPWSALSGPTIYRTTISDTVVAEDTLTSIFVAVIRDLLLADDTLSARADLHTLLSDEVNAEDFVRRILRELISDTVTLTDEVTIVYYAISRIIDAVLATGAVSTVMEAKNALIEQIYVSDFMARSFPVAFSEVLELGDTLRAQLTAATVLVDQALAQDAMSSIVAITTITSDNVDATDAISTVLEGINSFADGVRVVATLMIDGNLYTGVIVNAELGAVSEYDNWDFNAMTEFAGMYVGTKRDGVYIQAGETDNGEEIDSYVRSGLMRVAGGLRASVPVVYFGVAAKGIAGAKPRLLFKAITSEHDGKKKEYWYELEPREGYTPTGTRVKVSRDLSPILWQFEARSIKGTMFDLHDIKMYPIPIQRRIP